jgi:adenylosuccinate synthase
VPQRLAALGIPYTGQRQSLVMSDGVIQQFLNAVSEFKRVITLSAAGEILAGRDVVFEGSQGLLLDRDNEQFFPHVTDAKTGLHNIEIIAAKAGIVHVDATYVMRAYMTRHGAGVFPTESKISYADDTNVNGPWQGALRFGALDLPLIGHAVCDDHGLAGISVSPSIAVTHLDQVTHDQVFYSTLDRNGEQRWASTHWIKLLNDAIELCGVSSALMSWGPMARDIVEATRQTRMGA